MTQAQQPPTRALILADRQAGGLLPLAEALPPALVPIAGKPVLQHCIEDLWEGGVREAVVLVPRGDRRIQAAIGNGQRLGMALRYVASDGRSSPLELLAALGAPGDDPQFVARGDVLRGRSARLLSALAAQNPAGLVQAAIGSRPVGIARLQHRCEEVNSLAWNVGEPGLAAAGGGLVDVGAVGFEALTSLPGYFETSLGALEGRFAGLVVEGRRAPGATLSLGPRAAIARSVAIGGTGRVGMSAALHAGVELAGRVDIGDRCVIDEGAQLLDAVVMAGTYVGRGVRLQNAIACGPWLYRADLQTCQRVDDPLLLAGPSAGVAS